MATFLGIGHTGLACSCLSAFLGAAGALLFAILKYQGPYRANLNALIADVASRLSDGLILEGSNHSIEATMSETQHTHTEALTARPYAPAAQDAFIGVIDKI